MEPVLTNRCLMDEAYMRRFYKRVQRPLVILRFAFSVLFLAYAVYFTVRYTLKYPDLRTILLALLAYAIAIGYIMMGSVSVKRSAKLYMRRLREERHADSMELVAQFSDEGITVSSSFEQTPPVFGYDSIKRILEGEGVLLLRTKARLIISLDPSRFENGTEADFWRIMNQKCPQAVPKKHRA